MNQDALYEIPSSRCSWHALTPFFDEHMRKRAKPVAGFTLAVDQRHDNDFLSRGLFVFVKVVTGFAADECLVNLDEPATLAQLGRQCFSLMW